MQLSIIDVIQRPCKQRFEQMLLAGSFPKVGFSRWEGGKKYNMIEYSAIWARFMKCVDGVMKKEVDPELGAFTRKHSAKLLAQLQTILESVIEGDVLGTTERFKTMWD